MRISGGLSYINIANAQGEVRASSIPGSIGKVKIGDREYFRKAMKGEVNVSNVYLARTTGKPAFAVAAPIRDEGGKIVGILAGVPDLGKFSQQFVDPVKVLRSGYLAVTDSTGVVIAHKDESLIFKMNLNDQDFGREMLRLKRGHLTYEFQGQKKVAFLEQCGQVDWMISVVAPHKEVVEDAHRMALMNVAILFCGLGLVILVLFFIAHSITRPINRVVEGLSGGAEQVAAAASHISAASQHLAEGASEQAASIQETSSSLEQMSSMTRQNAHNADLARSATAEAFRVIQEAHGSMDELRKSMGEISVASEETQKIVKTIDEIAFQTNLLALNAAVEAARAGEAGAGFAVVADEVRNLALRAADAAKNTDALIEDTVRKVKDGTHIAAKARDVFDKVASSSGKVGELVGEIAAASREQAQGIDQINKAVAEMDKVVQQNAADAEESASSSEEMNAQAEQLRAFVQDLAVIVEGEVDGSRKKKPRTPDGAGDRPGGLMSIVRAFLRPEAKASLPGDTTRGEEQTKNPMLLLRQEPSPRDRETRDF